MTPQTPDLRASRGPLATPLFRALWIATIISNVGTWMNDVGSSWLMTSLSPSPLWVALVQAATTLPMFLFALPGGALADVVDRRRLLIWAQVLTVAGAATLAVTTHAGLTTPIVLLGLTAVMGLGAALSAPAFQAIVPELVEKPALPDAIALNSLGINISRAIGPALGGVIVAVAGSAAVFTLNALSILTVIAVLWRWRREPPAAQLPPEHFWGAIRAGYRYARRAPALQLILIRSVGFFLFASALWAMLPLVGRRELGLSAAGYGALLGCLGVGAIVGAVVLARARKHVSPNRLSAGAAALFAGATLALAHTSNAIVAGGVMVIAGLAWITVLSSLNLGAQMAVPAWVKARGLAVYLLVFQGAMTVGSILWGALASKTSVAMALTVAGVALALASLLAFKFRLPATGAANLLPSGHWAEPTTAVDPEDHRGPVMVMIEYRIAPAMVPTFVAELRRFKRVRERDGGMGWRVFEDAAEPGLVVETFILASWLEHKRQHQRVTHDDRVDQEQLSRFQVGDRPPTVRHLIAPYGSV